MKDTAKPVVSVVVPVYGSDEVLHELYRRTASALEPVTRNFELILVNDASPDKSPDNAWRVIQELAANDPRVRGLNLSRNFGQYAALTAGLQASRGEWIVVMDCDLQDQPEAIEAMYHKTQEGYFVVVGSRKVRHDSPMRTFFSVAFYTLFGHLAGRKQDRTLTNFGMYHRRVIDAILSTQDRMRYFSVMVRWVGFRTATIPVEHAPRRGGKSGYSLRKLFSLAIDIVLAYSEKPLRLIVKVGVIVLAISGVYLVLSVGRTVMSEPVSSTEWILGSLWFIFGALSTMIGVVALYIGKTFEEVKKRPIYIVQEEV
jgi:polyisoprenyl-phosphate glycosyltransferase